MEESTGFGEVSPEEAAAEKAVVDAILARQDEWRTEGGISIDAFRAVAEKAIQDHPEITQPRRFVRELITIILEASLAPE